MVHVIMGMTQTSRNKSMPCTKKQDNSKRHYRALLLHRKLHATESFKVRGFSDNKEILRIYNQLIIIT